MYVCASSTIGVNDPAKSVKLQNIVVVLEGKREVSKIHDLSALPKHLVMVMNPPPSKPYSFSEFAHKLHIQLIVQYDFLIRPLFFDPMFHSFVPLTQANSFSAQLQHTLKRDWEIQVRLNTLSCGQLRGLYQVKFRFLFAFHYVVRLNKQAQDLKKDKTRSITSRQRIKVQNKLLKLFTVKFRKTFDRVRKTPKPFSINFKINCRIHNNVRFMTLARQGSVNTPAPQVLLSNQFNLTSSITHGNPTSSLKHLTT